MEINNRQNQKLDKYGHVVNADFSIETPVSPMSTVNQVSFNPFSAIRTGNGIFGMSQFKKNQKF